MTASLRDRFGALLFTQVDIASLVVFRIAFGLLMAWEGQHLLASGAATEWMGYAYRFSYPGFSWVRMWPGEWIYLHVYALAALGLCIAAGFLYRAACALFAVGFAWIFLLDEAFYLNHFYLICLMSAGMALLPAHRAVSVDAWLRPSLRSETIPAWPVWLLRAQMGFVYFFGGIAKLDAGWLSGSVMAGVLPNLLPYPYVQDLWAEPWFAVFLAWGGLLLDLFVVPALLWRPTRYWALAFATGFHLANHAMWNIGVFPWLAIAATLVFLDPDWPRRVFNWPRRGGIESPPFAWTRERRVVAGLFAAYLLVHVLLPLRPLLYPGPANWTEEGQEFAWRMMQRTKTAFVVFKLEDSQTGRSWLVNPVGELSAYQARAMAKHPRMLHQYAHHLADLTEAEQGRRPRVKAYSAVKLNGSRPAPLVSPTVDLAAIPLAALGHADWIEPPPDTSRLADDPDWRGVMRELRTTFAESWGFDG